MAYYSINDHAGEELIAVVEGVPEQVTGMYCANEIAGVQIDGDTVRVRDPNGTEFLAIKCNDSEEAANYALAYFGFTCDFDT